MVGARALSRFLITERLGEGGNGTVYRAWDERLERAVAVKVIDARRAGARLTREAQAAARLNHPSIVTLYELGEHGSSALLVSELVEGESLRELILDGGLRDRDVAEAGSELCDALAHAHERGVVHRDIKPENVILTGRGKCGPGPWDRAALGRAMLTDFGIASIRGAEAITATGDVVGTLAYMAPEQAAGLEAGPEADVYSLALTMYECWAGFNPVARSNPAETARAIGGRLPPLVRYRPDLPPELTATLDASLAPDPLARPDIHDLREELIDAAPRLDARRPLPAVGSGQEGRRPGRRRAVLRAGALAAVVGLVVTLATVAALPGAALAVAVLALPLPLLSGAAWEWVAPALAPLLAPLGLAPIFPAVAGLAAGARRAATLALFGFAWLVAAEAALGTGTPLAVDPAPPGWERSAGGAAEALFGPLLSPEALAAAALWCAAAPLLALVLRARPTVVRLLGALIWTAAVVWAHRVLPAWDADAPAAVAGAILALVGAAIWARSDARPSARGPLGGERREAVPAASLP